MKMKTAILSVGILAGIIAAGALAQPAFAWHPKGVIVKKVQNITTGSELADANTAAEAVAAKPGDTLKYVITVSNKGDKASNGDNDMVKTTVTDTLPAGVALADGSGASTLTAELGRIKPGETKTKEFTVKVTAETAGNIQNTACFTGDSGANDNPQKGCDSAYVTVTVPEVPVTPVTPETPKTPEVPAPKPVEKMPAELPHTGTSMDVFVAILAISAAGYAAYHYLASRRDLARSLLGTK